MEWFLNLAMGIRYLQSQARSHFDSSLRANFLTFLCMYVYRHNKTFIISSLLLLLSLVAATTAESTAKLAFPFSPWTKQRTIVGSSVAFTRTPCHRRFFSIRGGSTTTNQELLPENHTSIMNENPDQVIGGGAINEKKRTFVNHRMDDDDTTHGVPSSTSVFQGTRNQAHFLHAMEGLDRYPNYLAKWSPEDAENLEEALQQRLDQVRQQRKNAQIQHDRLQQVIEKVCQDEPTWKEFLEPPRTWDEIRKSDILDTSTNQAVFQSKFFRPSKNHTVPSVNDVLCGAARVELDAGYLEDLMDEEVFDVYSFPLLSESFCIRLQTFTRRIIDELDKIKDPDFVSGGQRRVRNLDNLGLSWLNDLLFQLVIRPISRELYRETEMGGDNESNRGDLDWRHGFIAAYSANPDAHRPRQRLVPHTDDAEVTLNVCIGDVFEGGKLNFWGLRGTDMAGKLVGEYTPQRGRALLHAGRQLHEVTDVTSGERFALIMWTRSWGGIRSTMCPCCWLTRRTDGSKSSCICSARWN